MEHYQHLILKGLINGGGSSSETYVYQLLIGDISEQSSSVSHMWDYLDKPLQALLVDIFTHVCGVDLEELSEKEMIAAIIEYMAKKAGLREVHAMHDELTIDRMSDDEYDAAIAKIMAEKKAMLLNKE